MAAQPAIKMNTVVGKPGTKMPTMPNTKDNTASTCNAARTYHWRAIVGAGGQWGDGGLGKGAGSDIARLCLCRYLRVLGLCEARGN